MSRIVLALLLAARGVVVLPAAAAACGCVGDTAAGFFARADVVVTERPDRRRGLSGK